MVGTRVATKGQCNNKSWKEQYDNWQCVLFVARGITESHEADDHQCSLPQEHLVDDKVDWLVAEKHVHETGCKDYEVERMGQDKEQNIQCTARTLEEIGLDS